MIHRAAMSPYEDAWPGTVEALAAPLPLLEHVWVNRFAWYTCETCGVLRDTARSPFCRTLVLSANVIRCSPRV